MDVWFDKLFHSLYHVWILLWFCLQYENQNEFAPKKDNHPNADRK